MPDRQLLTVGGMLLTGTDPDTGCDIRTFDIAGWSGSPASSLTLTQKPRQPGGWLGPRQLVPRVLSPNGIIEGPSTDAVRATLDKINAAFSVEETTFAVTEGSLTRSCQVYRQGEVLSDWTTDTLAAWSAQAVAPDPRKYGAQIIATTGLPASTGGLTWPVTWPIEWDDVTTSGTISINNPGNFPSPVLLRIDAVGGNCVSPQIRHIASGKELKFASDYTIPHGSYLLIDMDAQTVLEGGTASRNGFITSRGWFSLDPGANETIFAAASTADALLTMTVSPAYQ